tara:strand:- start:93 stop:344 length:252 start_codon:yes stop_codon:yes gene_type:complete
MFTVFAGLTSTPAPTAILAGILSIFLFAIVGIVIGPGFEGINAPSTSKKLMNSNNETSKNSDVTAQIENQEEVDEKEGSETNS